MEKMLIKYTALWNIAMLVSLSNVFRPFCLDNVFFPILFAASATEGHFLWPSNISMEQES